MRTTKFKDYDRNAIVIFFSIVSLWNVSDATAQQSSTLPANIRAVNTIERLTDSNGLGTNEMMMGIPLPEGKVIGDTYLNLDWKRTTILLYEDEKLVEGYSTRYDIQTNELDIKTGDDVKVLSGNKVKTFVWMDSGKSKPSYFINAKDFQYNDTKLIGFFEVMVDGQVPLLKKINLVVKKADYNVALSTGSIDDKILKIVTYYYLENGQIIMVPSSKKKLLPVFHENTKNVGNFIKTYSLSAKKEDHLVQIFSFYNTLITKPKEANP